MSELNRGKKVNDLYMEKVIIESSECREGMVLRQSILDEHTGAVIIPKGEVLNEEHIDKLKNFEHTQIWVEIMPETQFWQDKTVSYEQYKAYAKALEGAFSQASYKEDLDLEQFNCLAKMIVRNFKTPYDQLGCIGLLPKLHKNIYYHSINIAFLALLVGKWQLYDEAKLEKLVLTALLHDVGKIRMERALYEKREEQMTLCERLEYRRHTIYGYEMLAAFNELDNEVLKGVLLHHECMDGSGFPLSIQVDQINDFAKVIAIVDTYDKLKEIYPIFEAIRHLGSLKLSKFEGNMVLGFCQNVVNYYVGCQVLLSNGKVGEVTMIQPNALYRPIIKIGDQSINLYEQTSIQIKAVL